MSLVQFPRCTPSLLQLEDRCNPVEIFTVTKAVWNPAVVGSLPWVIAEANSAKYPGQDFINFDYSPGPVGLGPKPTLTSTDTLFVTEGVIIQGTFGTDYVTIDGVRPFEFSHSNPAPGKDGNLPAIDSQITGMTFSKCAAPIGQSGGAVVISGGTLTLDSARFLDNSAQSGGAVLVGLESTLTVDGITPAPPDYHPAQAQPRTLFKGNNSVTSGGAIDTDGNVILRRAWFIENKASDGGAIRVHDTGSILSTAWPGPEGPVNPDVQFLSNQAVGIGGIGGIGGGVCFESGANSKLEATIFAYNRAVTEGGGFVIKRGMIDLVDVIVANNKAASGAGIQIAADAFNVATVNANGVSFFGNVDLLGKAGDSAAIGNNGILNTSGCFYDVNPRIIPGTNGIWSDSP